MRQARCGKCNREFLTSWPVESADTLCTQCWLDSLPADEWTESAENEPDLADEFEQRDSAPLVKSQPTSVKAGCFDI